MAAVTGAATNAILKVGTTYGTATTGSTNDKFVFSSLTASLGETVLSAEQLGAGLVMAKDATKAAIAPLINVGMNFGARNLADLILLGFFQADTATEETASQGDYRHRMTLASTIGYYLTLAHDRSSSTVTEYPSCYVRKIQIQADPIPGYVRLDAELLANNRVVSSTTNDNAELAAATAPSDTELFTVGFDDDFWIGTQSAGALSGSDQLAITSYSLTLERPLEMVGEIRGAAGNGQARSAGIVTGELTVTLKDNSESFSDFFPINDAETAYKCKLNIEGSQIASGGNRALRVYVPRMKLIQSPQYDLTETGHNPLTLTWKILAADSAPTGMNSVYPYVEVVNTRTTALTS